MCLAVRGCTPHSAWRRKYLMQTKTPAIAMSVACMLGACAGRNVTILADAGSTTEQSGDGADSATTHDAAVSGSCDLTDTWSFGYAGGNVRCHSRAMLSPPDSLTIIVGDCAGDWASQPDRMCTLPLPACGTKDEVDASDLAQDFADPDVQRALVAQSRFGHPLPDRGATFLSGSDGRSLSSVGGECSEPPLVPACTDAPAGVRQLLSDLNDAILQGENDPACANLWQ